MNLLIVEDDEEIIVLQEKVCKHEGHNVHIVKTAKEALDLVGEKDFDLAIVDLMLPDMNGLELVAKIREIKPTLRIIFSTAFATAESEALIKKMGCDLLIKPFTVGQLTEFLHKRVS